MNFHPLISSAFGVFLALSSASVYAKAPIIRAQEKPLLNEILFTFPPSASTGQTNKSKHHSDSLKALKIAETSKQWDACLRLAPKVFQEQKLVKDWVLNSWLHCASKAFEEKHNFKDSLPVLQVVEKNHDLLFGGPARTPILQEMSRLRILQGEAYEKMDFKKNLSAAKENLEILLSYGQRLDHESRARAFYFYAELAQNNHQLKATKQFLEESLNEKESRAAREKLNSIQLALGVQNPPQDTKSEVNLGSSLPELELKAEDRLDQSLSSNDLIAYLEDGTSYLKKYPNGRRAKVVQDKILEIYLQIYERSIAANETDTQRFVELRERALNFMEKAEGQRLFEWAKSLHRRGDFSGAVRLAEKCSSQFINSGQSASLLWMLGRSYQFLGHYAKAQKTFEQYIELNSGGDEFIEIQMRLALVYFRQKQYSSAVATLERLLLAKNLERYELISRYWLIRSLQAEKNPRAVSDIAAFIEKYPFSYYGVRLRAESNQGILEWPETMSKSAGIETSFFVNDFQQKVFDRIDLLAENGWFLEAQKEISELPSVKDPMQKIFLAQRWAGVKAFPLVVKLTNEAGDLDPHLRSLDLIAVSFPLEYTQQIQKESDKNHLSPFLIKSLIRQESAFGPQALSSSNALGLMQLIPPTAIEVAQDLRLGKISVPDDVYDPDVNIQMGTYYLAKMIKKFGGSVPLGLAAYNAGPQKLQRFVVSRPEVAAQMSTPSSDPSDEIWIDELPWYETSFYVKAILRNVLMYKTLNQGKLSLNPVLWSDLVQGRAEALPQ